MLDNLERIIYRSWRTCLDFSRSAQVLQWDQWLDICRHVTSCTAWHFVFFIAHSTLDTRRIHSIHRNRKYHFSKYYIRNRIVHSYKLFVVVAVIAKWLLSWTVGSYPIASWSHFCTILAWNRFGGHRRFGRGHQKAGNCASFIIIHDIL